MSATDQIIATELTQDHAAMVRNLSKPGPAILEKMTTRDAHLIHMLMGICGEAGELLDAIKKHTIYQKPLDRSNIVEELGDLEFYLQGLRDCLRISREETLQANITKLSVRYATNSYSNEQAVARADKHAI